MNSEQESNGTSTVAPIGVATDPVFGGKAHDLSLLGPKLGNLGRPPKVFKEEYIEIAEKYFDDPGAFGDTIPTIAGLACHLRSGGKQQVYDWMELHPKFRDAVRGHGKAQLERQLSNRLSNKETYTQGTVFVAKNLLGWSDRSESQLENAASSLIQALAGSVSHGSLPLANSGALNPHALIVDPDEVQALPEPQSSDSGTEHDLSTASEHD